MEKEPMLESGQSSSSGSSSQSRESSSSSSSPTPEVRSAGFQMCSGCSGHQMRLLCLFSAWFTVGLYVYMSRPWGEEHNYYSAIESIYVMAQIVTTVGYGDYTPSQYGGMVFTSLYVLTAVLVLSSVVSTMTEAIISTEDKLIQNALGQVDLKSVKKTIKSANEKISSRIVLASEDPGDQGDQSGAYAPGSELMTWIGFSRTPKMHPASIGFLRAVVIWSLFVTVGVVFFCNYPGEEKTAIEAFYMSIITLTTVGFGDVTPRTVGGRLFATFWMLLGVAAFANMVGKFAAFCMAQDRLRVLDADTLLDIQHDAFYMKCHPPDDGPPPTVSRADFVLFMMNKMGVLDASVVEQLSSNFDDLDRDRSGYLDQADINQYHERIRQHLMSSNSRAFS